MNPEKLTLAVRVQDEEGRPISGASVQPTGLRSKEEPGSSYGFRRGSNGPNMLGDLTNAEGDAFISAPAHPQDDLTTGSVMILIEHAHYCTLSATVQVDAPRPVTLTRGLGLTFEALPIPNIAFSEVYVDIADEARQAALLKWTVAPGSRSVSANIPNGKYFARVVAFTAAGEVYFSDLSSFSLPDSSLPPNVVKILL